MTNETPDDLRCMTAIAVSTLRREAYLVACYNVMIMALGQIADNKGSICPEMVAQNAILDVAKMSRMHTLQEGKANDNPERKDA